MMYTPKNSRFNREANLLEKSIRLIEKKNGLVYFAVFISEEKSIYCSCEETLFDKEFYPEPGEIAFEIKIPGEKSEDLKNIKYKRYPIDLKNNPAN